MPDEIDNIDDLNQVMQHRRQKLARLHELGINPYPYEFERTATARDILDKSDNYLEKEVAIAGRLMAIRGHGKVSFAHVMDSTGRIQIYVRKDEVGDRDFEVFSLLDIGDIIGVAGEIFVTRTDETTIRVSKIELLSKTLRPLPIVKEKQEGEEKVVYDQFADKEQRYRQRYVDLVVNPEVRDIFVTRAKIISTMRSFLDDRGFLEVETPVLQPIYGGAAARPFVTHHNTLDMKLYLRIADELYLKRLIVGGYDGVYEISKDFRNEGMDRFHNPEFSMMELYVAYKDYNWMMSLVEEMVSSIAKKVLGSPKVSNQGHEIDLTPPWQRIPLFKVIEQHTGEDLYGRGLKELKKTAKDLKVDIDSSWREGKIIDEIFSEKVEPHLVQPTFVTDYPVALSPLAKKHRNDPKLVERFEPFILGGEIGNAYSELNDPVDQRQRFVEQKKLLDLGDEEAHRLDEDFLRSLEYGMPPTAGLGIGIDRLVMLFTGQTSIRDVVFFPQMRAEGK